MEVQVRVIFGKYIEGCKGIITVVGKIVGVRSSDRYGIIIVKEARTRVNRRYWKRVCGIVGTSIQGKVGRAGRSKGYYESEC